jgi:hypothetical protein
MKLMQIGYLKSLIIKKNFSYLMLLLAFSSLSVAQNISYPKAKVSFNDFKALVAEVEPHRASRLIDLNTFLKMSQEPGVIVLDTRSTFRFERIHLKGAKHLNFTDFTQRNLARLIPTYETKILINSITILRATRLILLRKLRCLARARVIRAQPRWRRKRSHA